MRCQMIEGHATARSVRVQECKKRASTIDRWICPEKYLARCFSSYIVVRWCLCKCQKWRIYSLLCSAINYFVPAASNANWKTSSKFAGINVPARAGWKESSSSIIRVLAVVWKICQKSKMTGSAHVRDETDKAQKMPNARDQLLRIRRESGARIFRGVLFRVFGDSSRAYPHLYNHTESRARDRFIAKKRSEPERAVNQN